MKRLLSAFFAAVFLLCGCGGAQEETVPSFSNISIVILDEQQDFGGFTAGPPAEAESARLLVESVLGQYPAEFPDQWGEVEILLVGNLTGTEAFAGGHYAGFTQRMGDGWRMVLDAKRCKEGTVHHEIAHILDGILTEAGALTEAQWLSFCPSGFQYGCGDWESLADFFVDGYAMTDIREDRARTFEEAAIYGPGVYADKSALWLKLEYFSRAIREHFDTEGWPEKTFWEMGIE